MKEMKLPFTAVLMPEDYGPVIRCMIISWKEPEELEWLEHYRFPGELLSQIRSDEYGHPDPMGMYYTIFPVNGPEIEWTKAFQWIEKTEKKVYRDLSLKGLECKRVVCPAADRFIKRRAYTKLKGADGRQLSLKYRDYLPEKYRDRKGVRGVLKGTMPLIIWLHGAGEGGKDPSIALLGNRVTALAEETVQMYFPETGAGVLVPQCPTMWMDVDGKAHYNVAKLSSDGASYYTAALAELIRRYIKYHPEVDRSRIYIGGCSNGGYMTIKMILEMPELFAAAFPCCMAYHAAWMTPERIRTLAKVPMWLTAAANDETVPLISETGEPAYSDALVEKLRAVSAEVIYSRLPQVLGFTSTGLPYEYFGHWSWIPLLQDQITKEFDGEEIHLYEWLASKHKA